MTVKKLYDASWGRAFAFGYELFLAQSERHGLGKIRQSVLKQASGNTVEIGAGTGLNIPYYPAAVTRLTVTEPSPHMLDQIREKTRVLTIPTEIKEASGERLPFLDNSFDTAVMTMVLCTAPDPPAVLTEIARVLKPGGQLLFFEHVRSHEPKLARWQERLNPAWRFFGNGCNPDRDTLATIERSPLKLDEFHEDEAPRVPPIVRPLIVGRATLDV